MDQPLAMSRGGQDYYVHADHQGSVIRVTDSAGAVVNSYAYDAYGQCLSATEGVAIAYGYTGREYDAESGLMYYRARVYDPTLGRFLQTDPLGFGAGDLNLYRYVGNDPVNFSDPSGECPLCIAAAVIAGGTLTAGAANAPGTDIDQSCLIGTNDLAPILNALTTGILISPFSLGRRAAVARVGGAAPVRVGQAGERAVRQVYNIGDKIPIRVNGRNRIPDGLTRTALSEVKNVKSLSYIRQLRDFADFARNKGLRFDLYVRPGAELSRPLLAARAAGRINILPIPFR